MPSNLPQRLPLLQMEQQWATQLNPVIANPIVNGQLLSNIQLSNGITVINHGLGRKLQGWFPVLISGPSTLSDNQLTNPSTDRTLSINSTAAITISLWVF